MVARFRVLAFLLLLTVPFTLFAQHKSLTIGEATNGLRTTLAPERLRLFEWMPGQKAFTRIITDNKKQAWVKFEVPGMKADTLLTTDQLNSLVPGSKPATALPLLHWLSKDEAWFSRGNIYYKGKRSGNSWNFAEWRHLPEEAENVFVNKESGNIAFTLKNNLYLLPASSNTPVAITADSSTGIVNGQSVHRDEFGIDHGIFFSPKGNLLAFYRMDERMVADYPIVDWSVVPAISRPIKYPMAGGVSHQVTLGVYNPATGKTIFMNTGLPADHYLTCVTWAPDQESIYIAILNREQNHLWLNQYSVASGELMKTLFEETDPRYVHPMNPLTFIPGSPSQFVWQSERDGYNHLYLYNTDGKLIRQLTKGSWLVNELKTFHPGTKEIIYTSNEASPLEKHIYAVNINTGKIRRLSTEPGWHDVNPNEDGSFLLDAYHSGNNPYTARLLDIKAKWQQPLLIAADPLKDYKLATVRNITLKADDGTDLYGKLMLPADFDSTRKYPVIVYLYNGPGVQLIKNTFPASGNLWYDYMTQHGFIVFSMDGRGSANRGLAFEQASFRHLGTVEITDQLKGVSFLTSLPYVDANRMGVHGWSYGGFMTTSLMLKHPEVFKVAVAGGPVIDWRMYEVMYTERYMDTPQENPAGYEESNLLTKTKNLKGKLLLIHGTADPVVVWQHSIDFLKACVDNQVQVDYFVYPGHLHNVLGKDREHLMQKVSDYFSEKLSPNKP